MRDVEVQRFLDTIRRSVRRRGRNADGRVVGRARGNLHRGNVRTGRMPRSNGRRDTDDGANDEQDVAGELGAVVPVAGHVEHDRQPGDQPSVAVRCR